MGHDIRVVNTNDITILTTYLSGNFSSLGDIYGGIRQMHGHTGRTVSHIAHKAITRLLDEGIIYRNPSRQPDWFWGINEDQVRMPEHEFKSVYLYHLFNLRILGELCYLHRFYSDQVFSTVPYEDEIDPDFFSEGENDEIATENDSI